VCAFLATKTADIILRSIVGLYFLMMVILFVVEDLFIVDEQATFDAQKDIQDY
jgi:hypothetical protein